MVDDLYERLGLSEVIGPLKTKGIPLDALAHGLLAYKMGDNFSVLQASEWLNQTEMLGRYELKSFDEKTLYRAVETLGHNRERIIQKLQDHVLELLGATGLSANTRIGGEPL
jgi:transposase